MNAIVPKIVIVGELTSLRQTEVPQQNRVLIGRFGANCLVIERGPKFDQSDLKGVEMAIRPAHRNLNNLMEVGES